MRTTTIALVAGLLVLAASCQQQEKKEGVSTDVVNVSSTASSKPAEPGSLPVLTFNELTYDFGKITQGEKVSHAFGFKNTGGTALVISSAQGSCGCTVPQFPREPIAPGAGGKIDVTFNSEGKAGKVEKTITVVTNCEPNTLVISVKAEIIVPEEK